MTNRTIGIVAVSAALSIGVAQEAGQTEIKTVSEIAAALSKQTGVGIYLESRAEKEKVKWPVGHRVVTAETLHAEIELLVKAMPKGSDWGLLYLPPPPEGKLWKGDDVLAYARAQAKLYGKAGSLDEGSTEILSQKLLPEKSKAVIEALNLKRVYVIALGPGTFEGVWQSTYGEMRLSVKGTTVTGTYTSGNGEIHGVLRGNTLTFRWYESANDQGGSGVFALSEDGDSFTGDWWSDGNEGATPNSWTGTRISR